MLLSYSHNFLFVHVPKAAGVSVTQSLVPYAYRPEDLTVNRLLNRVGIHANLVLGPYTWRWFRLHHSAQTIRRHLPVRVYNNLFKFAFVRNPWDAVVSFFHYCLENPTHHRHKVAVRLGSFTEFIKWRANLKPHLQANMVCDRQDRPLVDFLGRFESLEDDFNHVCRRIGIHGRLPRLNTSKHRDYRSYYNDTTAELVATHWRRDIDLFGYNFDGVNESSFPVHTLPFTPRLEAANSTARPQQRRAAA